MGCVLELNDAMGELQKMPALILNEKYIMAIFEEYWHELPPFKTYWDHFFTKRQMLVHGGRDDSILSAKLIRIAPETSSF